ncbi:STAS domain-containing protein [Streptomyces polygonati]|uniref:Anti-sigma factor antagonist n=1 Tax=Streptomyces polygonati TaxID=1617087 RepID=A0ABV8HZ11_9ACTN
MTAMRTMTLYRRDDRATVFLEGEIDLATAPAVGVALHDCLSRAADSIDVDLTRLTFCDASGLNVFLAATRHAQVRGGRLRLHGSTPAVRRIFELTGTTFLLDTPRAVPSSRSEELPPMPPVPGRPAAFIDQ